MSKPKEVCRHYDTLKTKRVNFDNTVQEIKDYIAPYLADVTTTRTPGEKVTQHIFDATAGYAADIFSQFVQGSICNQQTKWVGFTHKDPKKNESQENASYLLRQRDKMLAMMARSYYGPFGQAINSWTLTGNAPLLIEPVPQKREGLNKIRYTSVPFGQYVMAEGDDGKIDQFIRCLRLPAHQAVKLGNVSEDITKAAEKEPLKEFDILHSILPRDFQDGYVKKSKIETAKDMRFASCWIEKEKQRLIKESGYRKFPVAVARAILISGETYARGWGELALPDSKSLNQSDQKSLLMWDRLLDPPTITKRNSIVGRVLDKRGGGDTLVNDINNSVKPLFEGADWPAHDKLTARKEQAILRVFHVNEILNLLAREKPEMTAFEVNARLTLLQQILGPVFGLLNADFLEVIVDVTLDDMASLGMLDQAPDDFAGEGDDQTDLLNIVYEGPLARAQRNQEIVAIQQSLADMAGLQPFYPNIMTKLDEDKTVRKLFDIRGTQDLLKSEEDALADENALIEQQNAEKELMVAAGGAEAAGKVAPFLKVSNDIATGGRAAA